MYVQRATLGLFAQSKRIRSKSIFFHKNKKGKFVQSAFFVFTLFIDFINSPCGNLLSLPFLAGPHTIY